MNNRQNRQHLALTHQTEPPEGLHHKNKTVSTPLTPWKVGRWGIVSCAILTIISFFFFYLYISIAYLSKKSSKELLTVDDARAHFLLTGAPLLCIIAPVTAHSVTGFSSPTQKAQQRPSFRCPALFLCPPIGGGLLRSAAPSMAGGAGRAHALPVPFARSANPASFATSFSSDVADSIQQKESNMSKTATAPKCAPADACKALFGRHPEDVLLPLQSASEAFSWLEEVLRSIVQEATNIHGASAGRVIRLAEAARYIACDVGNYAYSEHEDMSQRLVQTGQITRTQGENA